MISLYFVFLIFTCCDIFADNVLTEISPSANSSQNPGAEAVATAPTSNIQTVGVANNEVATVVPSMISKPNLELSPPNAGANNPEPIASMSPASSVADAPVSTTESLQKASLQSSNDAKPIPETHPVVNEALNSLSNAQINADANSSLANNSITSSSSPLETIPNQTVDNSTAISLPPEINTEHVNAPDLVPANSLENTEKKIDTVIPLKKNEQDVMSSINSMNVEEEGNWLLKRVWWEQAEQTFEKIINLNDDVVKSQVDFLSKRNELDKKLNELFRKLGFDQGEISQILEYFLHELSAQRDVQGLEASQREFFDVLSQKKEELEKLKTDLTLLSELDVKVDDVVTQLVDQVNKAREYEKNAWQDFKEIGRVLNDKKAKVLFYQIEANLKSIQSIQNYLNNELHKYYQDLLDTTDTTSNSIVTKINELENQVGSFKAQFDRLQNEEKLRKQNELDNKLNKQVDNKKDSKTSKQKGWFQTLIDKVKSIF